MREGFLERDGVRLHWVEWGASDASGTPLFCLHGLSSNALYWGRLAGRLGGRRVVALDQRAHGRSDAPATGYGVGVFVDDAALAIRELGLARPLVVGHSWGALIALELAALHPELAGGLAHLDGPGISLSQRLTWEQVAELMQPPLPVFGKLEEAWADQARYLKEAWDDDLRAFAEARTVPAGESWRLTLTAPVRLEILRSMYHSQPELLWERVRGPLLVGLAESGMPMRAWKQQVADLVLSVRPDADVRWYPSDHDIPLILPERVAADLEAILPA